MRKRLVIGAVAAVVIGVAAYVFSQPKKGTVEWHKRGYLEALNAAKSGSWTQGRFVPEFLDDWYWRRNLRRGKFHQQALIDAGYLTNASFVVYNASSANEVIIAAEKDLDASGFDRSLTVLLSPDDPYSIAGILPVDSLERVSQALRKADVPETK